MTGGSWSAGLEIKLECWDAFPNTGGGRGTNWASTSCSTATPISIIQIMPDVIDLLSEIKAKKYEDPIIKFNLVDPTINNGTNFRSLVPPLKLGKINFVIT
jgi:hypothetical protein